MLAYRLLVKSLAKINIKTINMEKKAFHFSNVERAFFA